MNVDRLVIVGGGLAGIRACESARREGYRGAIVLVSAEEYLPYDRPPLSKELLMADSAPLLPVLRDRQFLTGELDVDVRLDTPATALDVERRLLSTADGDIGYDALIIAVGASARTLPGAEGVEGIHTVRTFADSSVIWRRLREAGRIVVVGAGFIGAEVASAARRAGKSVTIVEAADAPLTRSLGASGGRLCMDLHSANGTDLIVGVGVAGFQTMGTPARVSGVRLADGRCLEADLVVVGVGAVPATGWLEDSGVALASGDRGIECDENLAVRSVDDGATIPGHWAAGDVAYWPNGLFARRMRLEHWTSAAEQGAHAARNALEGGPARPYQTVPYFWSDWYGTRLQFVGVAAGEEILVQDRSDARGGTVVLYRDGDQISGALTIGRPDLIMKYRRMVSKRANWGEAVNFGAAQCI